jgi:hypothetical protein
MEKLLEGYKTILEYWEASSNTSEIDLANAMNLYTIFAYTGKKYMFTDECDCKGSRKVTFKSGFGSFCCICGTLVPF